MKRTIVFILISGTLSACSGLCYPPSAEKLAALPIVTYPDKPGSADFIYKLPANKPIDLHFLADGSALANSVSQTLSANLKQDLYLHESWASEDGKHWVKVHELISAKFTMALPSYETPSPGEMHLTVDRKVPD